MLNETFSVIFKHRAFDIIDLWGPKKYEKFPLFSSNYDNSRSYSEASGGRYARPNRVKTS